MGIGKDFAKETSQFISFDENGVMQGVFGGMKVIIKESFGAEKKVMRYKIDGKTFDSQSGSLAKQMDDVKIGDTVRILKTGSGMDTKYEVSV